MLSWRPLAWLGWVWCMQSSRGFCARCVRPSNGKGLAARVRLLVRRARPPEEREIPRWGLYCEQLDGGELF